MLELKYQLHCLEENGYPNTECGRYYSELRYYSSAFGSLNLQKGCSSEPGIFLCSPGLSPALTASSKFLGTSSERVYDQIFLAPSISAWLPRQEAYMAALMYRHNYPFYLTENSERFVPYYGFLARKLQMVFEVLLSPHRK